LDRFVSPVSSDACVLVSAACAELGSSADAVVYAATHCTCALAGWDPLNLRPNDPETWEKVQTRELKNGRLAMLAIAAFLVQENLTGQGPIEQLVAGHISPFGT
jgi:Chlorophyll A-B binding protein